MKKALLILICLILSIFSLLAQEWVQIGEDIKGEAFFDHFGASVSLNAEGTIVAIGANGNDNNGSDAGHVRIYKCKDESWKQIGNDIEGETAGDCFGLSVSINDDGSIVAIGAEYNDGNGIDAGHVRIYKYKKQTWSKIGNDIFGEAAGDLSGRSVCLSSTGSIIAIGAERNGGNGIDAGHVRIYKYHKGMWTQVGTDIDGEARRDRSGTSISLSGDGLVVAIGAAGNDRKGKDAGHVRIYKNKSGIWSQLGDNIDGEASSDLSGSTVCLNSDGTVVAVGAPGNDGNGDESGHVRVYKYINETWTQIGDDIDGESRRDYSSSSVSLNSDGSIVAIGSYWNKENGHASGHVRVYKNQNGKWTQIGNDIDGKAEIDFSGYSLDLSSDGSIVAIGAPGNVSNPGHVRIYKFIETKND